MPDGVLVQTADDMCFLLRAACPNRAAAFARAQHEAASWGFDDQRTEFWQDVMSRLEAGAEVPMVQAAAA